MTVPVQVTFTASIANGVTTVFPYAFKIADEDDLAVIVDGVRLTSGYSVSGVGDASGGDVTFDVAPGSGLNVIRALDPILKRDTDFQQFGDWTAVVVNNEFDRLWLAAQTLAQDASRSVKLPIDTAGNQEITADAAARANKGLKFDEDGNLTITTYDPDSAQGAEEAASTYAAAALASEQAAAASAEAAAESAGLIVIPLEVTSGGTGAESLSGLLFGNGTDAVSQATKAQIVAEIDDEAVQFADALSPSGYAGQVYKSTGAGSSPEWGSGVNYAASIALSGQFHDFTGIPSWAKRLKLHLFGVSTDGTSAVCVRFLDAGGVISANYQSWLGYITSTTSLLTDSTAFIAGGPSAATVRYVTLELNKLPNDDWSASLCGGMTSYAVCGGGGYAGSSEITGLRITTLAGTNYFDSGTAVLTWE